MRVELTLIDRKGVAPLLEQALDGLQDAGIHRFSLRGTAVHLKAGVDYEWSIAVVPDAEERSHDVLSAGAIRRVNPTAELNQQLRQAAPEQKAKVLASAGIWYDALAELSEAITNRPRDHELIAGRADLLEQVGLKDAAGFERR